MAPLAVRDRKNVELEPTLQDQDAHSENACPVDYDTKPVSQPRPELLQSVRVRPRVESASMHKQACMGRRGDLGSAGPEEPSIDSSLLE